MGIDEAAVKRIVDNAILEEKGKRIKKLVEKGATESFIMELFELDENAYGKIYNRLYPFGRFTGPLAEYVEKDFKTRMLKTAGYTDEEVQNILEKDSLFFPEEAESRLQNVAKKKVYFLLIEDYLREGKTESWIKKQLSLSEEEFLGYKQEAEKS